MAELIEKVKGLTGSEVEPKKIETIEDRLEQLDAWRKRTKAMLPMIRVFLAMKR